MDMQIDYLDSRFKQFQGMIRKYAAYFVILICLVVLTGSYQDSSAQVLRRQPFDREVTMLAADTSKVIVAAPGAGRTANLTYLHCTILVSAAQTVAVESTGSVSTYLKLAVSPVVNTEYTVGPFILGLPAPVNTAIQITPAAAGPSMHCIAEGYYTTTGQ